MLLNHTIQQAMNPCKLNEPRAVNYGETPPTPVPRPKVPRCSDDGHQEPEAKNGVVSISSTAESFPVESEPLDSDQGIGHRTENRP